MTEKIYSGVNPRETDRMERIISNLSVINMFPTLLFLEGYRARISPIRVETKERIQRYIERKYRFDYDNAFRLETGEELPAKLGSLFQRTWIIPEDRRYAISEMMKNHHSEPWYLVRTKPLERSLVLCMPYNAKKPVAEVPLLNSI